MTGMQLRRQAILTVHRVVEQHYGLSSYDQPYFQGELKSKLRFEFPSRDYCCIRNQLKSFLTEESTGQPPTYRLSIIR